jgi:putative tricarboxylic transport membrane protein
MNGRSGSLAMAVALLAGVAVAAWQVTLIPEAAFAIGAGPRAMPIGLVALLAVLGLAYLAQALRGRCADARNDPREGPLPGAGARLAALAAGLAAILVATPLAGIGPACVAGFWLVARAFGSRRWGRDLLVGGIFVLVLWLVFVRLLGVQLGPFVAGVPWP